MPSTIIGNAHAVCPVPRNLLDDQLRAIRDSGGLVGVSLSVPELRPDGHNKADTPLTIVLRHVEHFLEFLGPDGVAIGSDLDGALLLAEIGNAGGLGNLVAAMVDRNSEPDFLRKLCLDNWFNVLGRSWQ